MSKYFRIMRYAWQQPLVLFLMLCLTIATAGVAALQPWPIKILVDYALGDSSDSSAPAPIRSLLALLSLEPSPVVLLALAAVAGLTLFLLTSILTFPRTGQSRIA